MKKEYNVPTALVTNVQSCSILCGSINNTNSNLDSQSTINFGGGGSGGARVNRFFNLDEEEEMP